MISKFRKLRRLRRIRLHREGKHSLILGALVIIFFNMSLFFGLQVFHADSNVIRITVLTTAIVSAIVYGIVVNFFHCPQRIFEEDREGIVVSACDGKVVVIEEVEEAEYFHDRRLMVSVFMSLFDVHANWVPVEGTVKLSRHHDGNFHAAWLPKASIENERSTVVIETDNGKEVLVRQVAGAMARRVITYVQEGERCEIDDHMGFIKFGSRVDIYLPLDAKIQVEKRQKTIGNKTIIAKL